MKDKLTGDWLALSEADAHKIISHANKPWQLPLKLLFWYGFRATEVLMITPEHIQGEALVMRRLKGGELTKSYIHPDVREELFALAATKQPKQRLFPWSRISLWRNIQHAGLRAGVEQKYLHPHCFRHFVGRRLAKNGASPHQLMAYMGHRTLSASLMYTKLSCDENLSKKLLGL